MSVEYYDWSSTSSTTTDDWKWFSDTSSSTSSYYRIYSERPNRIYSERPRRYLVSAPAHWTDEDNIAFVHLLNQETRTGFIVEMVIKGDILITDPNIEHRSMKNFLPLLRVRARGDDGRKIDEFFKQHPLESE